MKLISWFLRIISPGYGWCQICGIPWNWCNIKSVSFTEHSGGFATCDKCWEKSTLKQVKKAYSDTYSEYWDQGEETLPHILECVEQEYNKTHK